MKKVSTKTAETAQALFCSIIDNNRTLIGDIKKYKTYSELKSKVNNEIIKKAFKKVESEVPLKEIETVLGEDNSWYVSSKGISMSEEAKEKLSQKKRGIPSPKKGIPTGKSSWMKGKKHSEESNKKNSESHKGKTPHNKGVSKYDYNQVLELRDQAITFKRISEIMNCSLSTIKHLYRVNKINL